MNTLKLKAKKTISIQRAGPVAWTRMTENLMPAEMEDMLTPERVTPAVVFMCSEGAPTGKIICAGAGAYTSAAIVETRVYLGENPRLKMLLKTGKPFRKLTTLPKPCSKAVSRPGACSNRFTVGK